MSFYKPVVLKIGIFFMVLKRIKSESCLENGQPAAVVYSTFWSAQGFLHSAFIFSSKEVFHRLTTKLMLE